MFDDDDDDNDDVVDLTDDNLIGTWYRYSRTLDGTSNDFINAKLVLEGNGTGNEYTYEVTGNDLSYAVHAVDYDITWVAESSELSILVSENDSSLIQGSYFIGSGIDFLRISDDIGMEDVFVRQKDVIDENFVGFWMLDTAYVESSGYAIYEYPTLIVENNGTMQMRFMEEFSWGVNGSFMVMENMTNPNYDNLVCSYHYSQDKDSLYFTHYSVNDIIYRYNPAKWEAVYYRYGIDWE